MSWWKKLFGGVSNTAPLAASSGKRVSNTGQEHKTNRVPNPRLTADLHEAIKQGDLGNLARLIGEGADLEAPDDLGRPPLHAAGFWNKRFVEIVQLLVANGANVNAKDVHGESPLHGAATHGAKDIAQMLIAKGAVVNATNNEGATPLTDAAMQGHTDIVSLLIANSADVTPVDNVYKATPLHWAVRGGYKGTVEVLVANGANVNAADSDGDTPLHIAREKGLKEIADILIAKGSDPDRISETQKSVLSTPAVTLKLRLSAGMPLTQVHLMFGKPYERCSFRLLGCDQHEVWRTSEGRLRVFYIGQKVEKWAVEPT